METALIDRLIALEANVTYQQPPAAGQPTFCHEPGRRPLLISAPHGAAHRRDGRYKQEDAFTAAFARLVAERAGTHVLYAFARSENDPNWDRESPYKDALRELAAAHGIRFVMDIHGMSDRHKFGIAVGTMCGASCRRRHEALIVATLAAAGFVQATAREAGGYAAPRRDHFVVNHGRFTGGMSHHTVTRFAAEELGIHAAQFELCAGLRVVRRGDPAEIVRAVAAFERLALALVE
jgi:hypothetical protein